MLYALLIALSLAYALFSWFSYSLTAPNLIISNWQPYWEFQLSMWARFFNDRPALTSWYTAILTLVIVLSSATTWWLWRQKNTMVVATKQILSWWRMVVVWGLVISPLFFSMNALSYDVFNYMFNAKMVVEFKTDPHVHTALEYSYDDWTRFMHNTHTAAPYGYGWTAFSVLPYLAGGGKFLPTWLAFRLVSLVSLALLFWALVYSLQQRSAKLELWQLALVFLNPLILVETISNFHNDLWMVAPAVFALGLVQPSVSYKNGKSLSLALLGSAGLIALSVSIKWATLVIVPIWLVLALTQFIPRLNVWPWWRWGTAWWPLAASVALFVPLLTERSQQFHPWYLSWSLVWIPFLLPSMVAEPPAVLRGFKKFFAAIPAIWAGSLLVLSVSSLYRYLPFLSHGGYPEWVLIMQKQITWIPFVAALLLLSLYQLLKKAR